MAIDIKEFQCRPIEKWPRKFTMGRKRAPFRATYGDTLSKLNHELRQLRATSVCLQLALRAEDIRLDGRPRANAQALHPGVILTCQTKHGPMQYPCDAFDHWGDNLRAIALALEALRKIDRYGVTSHGEQYTGWAALPPPNGDHWTKEQALEWLNGYVKPSKPWFVDDLIRQAEMKSHPDRGGNASDFNKVQQARKLLLG